MQTDVPILRKSPFFAGLNDEEILSVLHCVQATRVIRPRDRYASCHLK